MYDLAFDIDFSFKFLEIMIIICYFSGAQNESIRKKNFIEFSKREFFLFQKRT